MGVALQPIIFCGHGSNLYPLCDAGTESDVAAAKALLPIGNRPLIAFALQHVLSAGLTSCIVLAPSWQHAAIQKALLHLKLIAPAASLGTKRNAAESRRLVGITFGALAARHGATTAAGASASTPPSELTMHVELLTLGPHDGASSNDDATSAAGYRTGRLGTAELLRWVAEKGHLRNANPLVLPVDLIGPAFAIRDLIDVYSQDQAAYSDAPTACCALYERGAGVGLGKERDKEGPSRLISATSNDGDSSTARLAFLRDSDMTSDMEIRRSLLKASPRSRISTRLLDAHVYIFNRTQVLPLLDSNPRLTSLRDHVVPLIAKASWQTGLSVKAGWPLEAAKPADESGSVCSQDADGPQRPDTLDHSSKLQKEALARSTRGSGDRRAASSAHHNTIRCLAHVVRLRKDDSNEAAEHRFVLRANTLATYIEGNRWLLRHLAQTGEADRYDVPLLAARDANKEVPTSGDGISATAQISPDAIVATGVNIGERANVRSSSIGEGCEIARGAKLNNCILMSGAKVGENARLEGTIVCSDARIGAQCTLVDCDVGAGVQIEAQTTAKHEKLVGEQDEEEENDDEEGEEEEDSEDD